MDVKASLRHLRMAPRKVRLIVDLIRGMKATDAETRLSFVQRDAVLPVLKLLRSAMANAEHNFKIDRSALFVKLITADGGATLKRSRPRAQGRAAPIRKRTTHINLILSDVAPIAKKAKDVTTAPTEKKAVVKKTSARVKKTKA
ncbi:50S ribosomal protein L22 [Candidatus Uhrbacteria bacterium]|nr:50S ribosomal protein L22 [Candidatus Uhrbacteria bacterium]